MAPSRRLTIDEVRALGTTTDVVTAGAVLGIGRTTTYQLLHAGDFPVPVTRIGRRYLVAVAHLLRAIGVEEPAAADRPAASPSGVSTGYRRT